MLTSLVCFIYRYDKYYQTPRVWLTGYDEVCFVIVFVAISRHFFFIFILILFFWEFHSFFDIRFYYWRSWKKKPSICWLSLFQLWLWFFFSSIVITLFLYQNGQILSYLSYYILKKNYNKQNESRVAQDSNL